MIPLRGKNGLLVYDFTLDNNCPDFLTTAFSQEVFELSCCKTTRQIRPDYLKPVDKVLFMGILVFWPQLTVNKFTTAEFE